MNDHESFRERATEPPKEVAEPDPLALLMSLAGSLERIAAALEAGRVVRIEGQEVPLTLGMAIAYVPAQQPGAVNIPQIQVPGAGPRPSRRY